MWKYFFEKNLLKQKKIKSDFKSATGPEKNKKKCYSIFGYFNNLREKKERRQEIWLVHNQIAECLYKTRNKWKITYIELWKVCACYLILDNH